MAFEFANADDFARFVGHLYRTTFSMRGMQSRIEGKYTEWLIGEMLTQQHLLRAIVRFLILSMLS